MRIAARPTVIVALALGLAGAAFWPSGHADAQSARTITLTASATRVDVGTSVSFTATASPSCNVAPKCWLRIWTDAPDPAGGLNDVGSQSDSGSFCYYATRCTGTDVRRSAARATYTAIAVSWPDSGPERGRSAPVTVEWVAAAATARPSPSPSPTAAAQLAGAPACPATLGGWSLRSDPNDRAYVSIVGKVFRVSDTIAGAQGVTPQLLSDTQGWFHLECQYRPPDPKQVPTSNIPYVNVSWAESGTGSGGALFSGVTLCTGDPLTRADPQTGASETLLTSREKRAAAGYATGGLLPDATFRAAAERLLSSAASRAQSCPGAAVVGAVPPPGAASAPARSGRTRDGASDTDTGVAGSIVSAALDLAADAGVPVTTALIAVLSILLGIPGAADAIGGSGAAGAGIPVLVDPETGKPFTAWEPGKYGADRDGRMGQPGDLRYGGRWMPRARVVDELERDRAAADARARDSAAFEEGTDEARARWLRGRDDERAAEEARAWRERLLDQQRPAAERALQNVIDAASAHGYEGILDRLDHAYDAQGRLDPERVRDLQNALRARLGRDIAAPAEQLAGGTLRMAGEFVSETAGDVIRNPIIQAGIAVLSGGASIPIQVGILGANTVVQAWDGMARAADQAARQGRDLTYTDAIRAGVNEVSKNYIPRATYDLYQQQIDPTRPEASTTQIVLAVAGDVGTLIGLAHDAHSRYEAFRAGRVPPAPALPVIQADPHDISLHQRTPGTPQTWAEIERPLGSAEPAPRLHRDVAIPVTRERVPPPPEGGVHTVAGTEPAPAQGPDAHGSPGTHRMSPEARAEGMSELTHATRPRSLRNIAEGTELSARDAGWARTKLEAEQEFLSRPENRGLEVGYRPSKEGALVRTIRDGDAFKPPDMHAKTIDKVDLLLGAPKEHVDRAAIFHPGTEEDLQRRVDAHLREHSTDPDRFQTVADMQRRYRQRMDEFHDLRPDINEKIEDGRFALDHTGFPGGPGKGGVVLDGEALRRGERVHFAGDHDIMFYRYRDPVTGMVGHPRADMVARHQAFMRDHGVMHEGQFTFEPQTPNDHAIHRPILQASEPQRPHTAPELGAATAGGARVVSMPEGDPAIDLRSGGSPVAVIDGSGKIHAEYLHEGSDFGPLVKPEPVRPPKDLSRMEERLPGWRREQLH